MTRSLGPFVIRKLAPSCGRVLNVAAVLVPELWSSGALVWGRRQKGHDAEQTIVFVGIRKLAKTGVVRDAASVGLFEVTPGSDALGDVTPPSPCPKMYLD